VIRTLVRRSAYHDSVTLLRAAREMEAVPGVRRAAALMGTPQNVALLREAGLVSAEAETAGPTDLVLAVLAAGAEAAEAAIGAADAALAPPGRAAGASPSRPRSLDGALRRRPDATLALISVPGAHAGAEARRALRAGLDVMLFSDNVPVAVEIALKRLARERGRLLMGPDCGTAIVDGVPLGFANAVPRGRIGIAAASGTGLQEVACLVAAAGEGISHALGVGGRDLSDAVGGLMMEAVLLALGADPGTEVICIVGKPAGPSVARRVDGWAARTGKPCVVHVPGAGAGVGRERPRDGRDVVQTAAPIARSPGGPVRRAAATLEDAAQAAVALARGDTPVPVEFSRAPEEIERLAADAAARLGADQRFVRGVYAGGTLAWEAVALLSSRLTDVGPGVGGTAPGHRVVDLGDDAFTVGRPHPMIDGALRREWIGREGSEPETAVVLLDVVLGHGAHRDPAGEVLPALRTARAARRRAGDDLVVVASVCGTDADPQNRAAQVRALESAGVIVMPSNAQAARLAALVAARRARRPIEP
jgi:succinyl-CoA synthetase alpha subunit